MNHAVTNAHHLQSKTRVPRPEGTVRVLIIESSHINSQLLATVLQNQHVQVVLASSNIEEVLSQISHLHVDVALINATLEGRAGEGYKVAAEVVDRDPELRVLLLVDKSDRESVLRAIRVGALGVFAKDNSLTAMCRAVHSVYLGRLCATREELQYVRDALLDPPHLRIVSSSGAQLLTPREQEVAHWVVEGYANREIADRLGLSENTVKSYLIRIFEKLGISRRVELVLYAASQLTASKESEKATPVLVNDVGRAMQSCREAAEHFALTSQHLGEMFRDARGVREDLSTALMWFMLSELLASRTLPHTKRMRQELQARLAPEQVASAESQFKQWLGLQVPSPNVLNEASGLKIVSASHSSVK